MASLTTPTYFLGWHRDLRFFLFVPVRAKEDRESDGLGNGDGDEGFEDFHPRFTYPVSGLSCVRLRRNASTHVCLGCLCE